MRTLKYAVVAIVAGSAFLQPQADAHEEGFRRGQGLGGVWLVKLAPRDCTSGNPFPVPPTLNLFTFHEDGKLSASLQNYTASNTNRTLSHGLWRQKHPGKRGEHLIKFTHIRYDFATGVFLGTQQALSQLTLDRASDTFTAASTSTGFDANGNQAYTACAILTGERIELN